MARVLARVTKSPTVEKSPGSPGNAILPNGGFHAPHAVKRRVATPQRAGKRANYVSDNDERATSWLTDYFRPISCLECLNFRALYGEPVLAARKPATTECHRSALLLVAPASCRRGCLKDTPARCRRYSEISENFHPSKRFSAGKHCARAARVRKFRSAFAGEPDVAGEKLPKLVAFKVASARRPPKCPPEKRKPSYLGRFRSAKRTAW